MKPKLLLLCAILANLALTIGAGCATRESAEVSSAAAVPLINTQWRLTQLGGEVLANPEGTNAIGMQLQAQNPRVVGFSGCNRMFGGYVLEGDTLKFAQMGGTKMACLAEERMKLEQRYLEMFGNAARWRISGRELELLDAGGASIAKFVSQAP
jgi:heat shock protein HslJ